MIPFDHFPWMMVVYLIITVAFYVNVFSWAQGTSKVLHPLTIIEGTAIDFNLHFKVTCGEFIQTYEGTYSTMNLRTIDSMSLGPCGNLLGSIACFSIVTGRSL